ncbi:MAG TPA: Gfo/Idh/MocA family oxidoreductase [Candidatus Anammoximicrobium sp.]|nr:Gfo/Idh/MocA family oxidoreductase [Candidatus Anammoximicrobium sp.]
MNRSVTRLSRRRFFRRTLQLAGNSIALPAFVSSRVLAAPERPGANDRIGIGFIGLGARAQQIFSHLTEEVRVTAVCDVYAPRVAEATQAHACAGYEDYRQLLESRDVDAVIITTPDHWHALQVIHACEAGKDVFCEKPLSLTVQEGRAMVEAVRRHKRICQVGPQQRSIPAAIYACEFVRSGKLGKIREVHCTNNDTPREYDLVGEPAPAGLNWDLWLGPSAVWPFNAKLLPSRSGKFGWMAYRPWSGGNMTSWGTHGMDLMQWGLGMDASGPIEVEPLGSGLECPLQYRYPGDVVVKLDAAPQGGAIFVGERGTVTVACGLATWDPPELGRDAPPNMEIFYGHKGPLHTRQWFQCLRSRQQPNCCVETGHRTATVAHVGNMARWLGRRLRWDPAAERFVGDGEANALLTRPMRAPWHV